MGLGRITDGMFTCDEECPYCHGSGLTCENHPNMSWPDECSCGAGMPCPNRWDDDA